MIAMNKSSCQFCHCTAQATRVTAKPIQSVFPYVHPWIILSSFPSWYVYSEPKYRATFLCWNSPSPPAKHGIFENFQPIGLHFFSCKTKLKRTSLSQTALCKPSCIILTAQPNVNILVALREPENVINRGKYCVGSVVLQFQRFEIRGLHRKIEWPLAYHTLACVTALSFNRRMRKHIHVANKRE
jgi:hypothetical protein